MSIYMYFGMYLVHFLQGFIKVERGSTLRETKKTNCYVNSVILCFVLLWHYSYWIFLFCFFKYSSILVLKLLEIVYNISWTSINLFYNFLKLENLNFQEWYHIRHGITRYFPILQSTDHDLVKHGFNKEVVKGVGNMSIVPHELIYKSIR
jgi:hypothetical protein